MTFREKEQALSADMARFKSPQDRLAHVIQLGRKSPGLPDEFKEPELKLEGCLSNLWLHSQFQNGLCHFESDSDSAIVKGLAAIICNLFSGAAPEEILRADLSPLREAGLWQQLTPNRRTGLARMVDRIHEFARAHLPEMIQLYDAHNHLQDERLRAEDLRLSGCVVNGSCEEDWPQVSALAKKHSWITPAFGLHPWYIAERSANWFDTLRHVLDEHPNATIGEIGLDRWIENPNVADQERVFLQQLALAAERNLAASIHCLKAWGHLEECLKNHPRPTRGFLIHAYGGSVEMIPVLEKLGAYFSFSGYIAHERKAKMRDSFCQVPLERLLLETDAPDIPPPPELRLIECEWNHPQNIERFYPYAAQLRQMPVDDLARAVEANFQRLFLAPPRASG